VGTARAAALRVGGDHAIGLEVEVPRASPRVERLLLFSSADVQTCRDQTGLEDARVRCDEQPAALGCRPRLGSGEGADALSRPLPDQIQTDAAQIDPSDPPGPSPLDVHRPHRVEIRAGHDADGSSIRQRPGPPDPAGGDQQQEPDHSEQGRQ